jgi:hypothetical protein
MIGVHAAVGAVLLPILGVLTLVVGFVAARGVAAPWTDRARQALLGLVVAEVAIGLALAFRGAAPAEWLHWLYGGLLVAVLLAPAALDERIGADRRVPAIAVVLAVATVLAWRLGASG